jgi:hypothetical protein
MPQHLVIYPVNWKGEILEPGAIINAESPEDDALIEYVNKFGKLAAVPEEAPPGGEEGHNGDAPGAPGESGSATPPMTSTDLPGHVGRRVRHSTTA